MIVKHTSHYRKICSIQKSIFKPDPKNRMLNLGGGNWYYPRWENVDLYADPLFCDYRIDLRVNQQLPLPDGCTKLIFSSHLFEHVTDECASNVLKECNRLMKEGALIRVNVPCMEKAFQAYRSSDHVFFDNGGGTFIGQNIEQKLVNFFSSYRTATYSGGPPVPKGLVREKLRELDDYDFVKWCVSLIPENAHYKAHVNGYDYKKLKKIFEQAGFTNIKRSQYRNSSSGRLRKWAFDRYPLISLFVEAFK
jgi:ubiquinone/menaquinone biosynthesis C-methylase UbiE